MKKRIAIGLVLIVCFYVGTYFVLSRTSSALLKDPRMFYYVPCNEDHIIQSSLLQHTHFALSYVFYPVWYLDHTFFSGPHFITGIPMSGLE